MISLVLKLCLIGNCTGWSFRSRNILCKGFEMKSVSCFLFFLRLIGYWRNCFPQYISPQLNLQLKIEECEYEHRGRQRLNNESWKKFYSTINWQLSSVSGQTSWKYARMEIICPRNRRTKTLIDRWGGTNSMRAHRTRWERIMLAWAHAATLMPPVSVHILTEIKWNDSLYLSAMVWKFMVWKFLFMFADVRIWRTFRSVRDHTADWYIRVGYSVAVALNFFCYNVRVF